MKKKVFALVLSAVLVLSLAMGVSAEPIEERVYSHNGRELFKITNVTYDHNMSVGGYTLDCNINATLTLLNDAVSLSLNYIEKIGQGYSEPVLPEGYTEEDFNPVYRVKTLTDVPAETVYHLDKYGCYEMEIYYLTIDENGNYSDAGEYFVIDILEDKQNDEYMGELYGKVAETASEQATAVHTPVMTTSKEQEVIFSEFGGPMEAYNIFDNNYFKLRDVCMGLSSVGYNIDVTWDGEKNAINLITGQPYTEVGGENKGGDGVMREAVPSSSTVYLDGEQINLTAYTIEGNNFFKLRDLCQALDIYIEWIPEWETIVVDPDQLYSEN